MPRILSYWTSCFLLAIVALLTSSPIGRAADSAIELTRAKVIAPGSPTSPELKAVTMLIEEVEKRTQLRWQRADAPPTDGGPAIIVGTVSALQKLAGVDPSKFAGSAATAREGYRIWIQKDKSGPTIWVAGNDSRGVLFGVGRLLREMRMERQKVTLAADFEIATSPETPIRGHQLGYRPKTNSYDGWTLAMWEQYIRDLVVFGTNAVEIIPPRSDDAADSPHFPLVQIDMMAGVSRLCDEYGLDVWIWYPAMDKDYSDPKTVEFALKEWGEVFKKLPRINAVFVPGGDPGHTQPKHLLALLEKQTANLHRYHPRAQMWMSPQGFTRQWMDEFLALMQEKPEWLMGVVHGPQVRMSMADLRKALPKRYPIRDYPDITHSRHCQYPVPDWDIAFAVTQGREVSNPRPLQIARIFQLSRPHTVGFITYSEGCHDDVNKVIWSALGWDHKADVRKILREYARYFVAPAFEERFADGLFALEKNWEGPVQQNEGIDTTLKAFQAMEREASPLVKLSWRFQHALYRAYYDAYVRARLKNETELEATALARLSEAPKIGAIKAMAQAEVILDKAAKEPVANDLRMRIYAIAEGLFQSVRMQLSVERYQAIAVHRGANLDMVDFPLNSAGWLKKRFASIRELPSETDRLKELNTLVHRTDPGPGGFYDHLGDIKHRPHLVRGEGVEKDPSAYASSMVGFSFRGPGPDPTLPMAWWRHGETFYDTPLRMRYTGLDPKASYRVRVVYAKEGQPAQMRLMAGDGLLVHDYLAKPFEPLEFDIPQKATANGELTLTWNQAPGAGGSGRGCQVCEVWVIKQKAR